MGGRLILVKAVFLNIPFFWCSLVMLPNSTLNIIRAKIFNFISVVIPPKLIIINFAGKYFDYYFIILSRES